MTDDTPDAEVAELATERLRAKPRLRWSGFATVACLVATVMTIGTIAVLVPGGRGGGSSTAASADAAPLLVAIGASTTIAHVAQERSAADTALQLYFAWQRDDRVSAQRLATASGLAAVFAIPSTSAANLVFKGCTQPVSRAVTCSWTRTGGVLTMHVVEPEAGPPEVQSAELR